MRDLDEIFKKLAAPVSIPSAPIPRLKVNAHIHLPPNFSSFENIPQVADRAAAEGISVLGASNYYDYSVYEDFAVETARQHVYPLFGLEIICMNDDLRAANIRINDPVNPGKMYVCGKGITRFIQRPGHPQSLPARSCELLLKFCRNDGERIKRMVKLISKHFEHSGLRTLDTDGIIDMVAQRHNCPREYVFLQERHVAMGFQRAFFMTVSSPESLSRIAEVLGAKSSAANPDDAVAFQHDIRTHLMKVGRPAYVEEVFVTFDEARELILTMGGIPSYPILADGMGTSITEFERSVDGFVTSLKARGFHAAEIITNRNAPEIVEKYARALHAAGFIVLAGTEHNTLDMIPLEPVCKGGTAIPEEIQKIFWEGACVVAAHQHLTLKNKKGYVDSEGNLNPDASIESLAKLGAALIANYTK